MAYDPESVTHYVINKKAWEDCFSKVLDSPVIENSLNGIKAILQGFNKCCPKSSKDQIQKYFTAFKASHQGQLPPLLRFFDQAKALPDSFTYGGNHYGIVSAIAAAGLPNKFLVPVTEGYYAAKQGNFSEFFITDSLKIGDSLKFGVVNFSQPPSLLVENPYLLDYQVYDGVPKDFVPTPKNGYIIDYSPEYSPFGRSEIKDYLEFLQGRKVRVNLKKHDPPSSSFTYKHYAPHQEGTKIKGRVASIFKNLYGDWVAEVEYLEPPHGKGVYYAYALELLEETINFTEADRDKLDSIIAEQMQISIAKKMSTFLADEFLNTLMYDKPPIVELPEAAKKYSGLKPIGQELLVSSLSDELEKTFNKGEESDYLVYASTLNPQEFSKHVNFPIIANADTELRAFFGDPQEINYMFGLDAGDPVPSIVETFLKEWAEENSAEYNRYLGGALFKFKFKLHLYVVKDTNIIDKKIKSLWQKIQDNVTVQALHAYNKLNIKKWLE